jgi:hypothetical protein
MIVIRDHVNRRIFPYTVVYDRACLTWVIKNKSKINEKSLTMKGIQMQMTSQVRRKRHFILLNESWSNYK